MRILQRSIKTIYYRLYSSAAAITTTDEWNNTVETGEYTLSYGNPVEMQASVSTASGASITEQFGNLDNYDKVVVTSDMNCPITESSVLYIDVAPTQSNGVWSPHDYVVRRIAKSTNYIAIAVRKVDVS